jgi:hypothetical protein
VEGGLDVGVKVVVVYLEEAIARILKVPMPPGNLRLACLNHVARILECNQLLVLRLDYSRALEPPMTHPEYNVSCSAIGASRGMRTLSPTIYRGNY